MYLLLAFSGSVVGRLCHALYFLPLPLGQLTTFIIISDFRTSTLSTIARADFSTSDGERFWASSNCPCPLRFSSVTTIQSPELDPSAPLTLQALAMQSAFGSPMPS